MVHRIVSMLAEPGRRATPTRLVLVLSFLGLGAACDIRGGADSAPPQAAAAQGPAGYVGGQVCAGCHAAEAALWLGSHHDLALQTATAETVLGDFDGAEFVAGDVTTRFSRRDGGYFVLTDGPDGGITEFEVSHVLGVEPLQQYLVALADGRIQALPVAWDSRPADAGGQRWFHLYPDEIIDFRDPLHWTGIYQSWNSMCADCHSTNLVKDYDREADRFATRFSSIDVDCEACHGPGSLHAGDPAVPVVALGGTGRSWVFPAGEAIAVRQPAPGAGVAAEIEVCARCHSRRAQLSDDFTPGDALLDAYRPELLSAGLYHADGQILEEVYVYGSFRQSAMAAAGVVCSDCHDPHSARLRAEGNAVCGRCHLASVYEQPAHHRHEPQTAAAECTSCHMRAETYMVVDPRRDHSFRVPRPDLTAALASPNACNDCHTEQDSAWAAARVAEWYPEGRWSEPHFGQVIGAARDWDLAAHAELTRLLTDDSAAEIVQATAMSLLAQRMAPADEEILRRSLDGDRPLLQLAAIEAAAGLAPDRRIELLQRFLTDAPLALRTAAARSLVQVRERLSIRRQADLDAAIAEYLAVQDFNSDRPEGLLNAANVAADQGRYDDAETLYRLALARHPAYPALYVNLADLLRLLGRAEEGEATLRAGLAASPESPPIQLALGFAVVRRGAPDEALQWFRAAAENAPDEPYYQYVRAIAENDAGDTGLALELLSAARERFPGYPDLLLALATIRRDAGEIEAAAEAARQLVGLQPGDAGALALLRDLEQRL